MTKADKRAFAYAKSHAYLGYDYDQTYDAVKYGYLQAEKDLGWHSVEESLPPIDEEVIVLLAEWNQVSVEPLYRIAFGHIVNKEYCEDFNGWNIPGVKYWMPMPKIPKEGQK